MKPEVDQVLQVFAGTLAFEVAPNVTADYPKSTSEVIAMLLVAAAEEYDRAAAIRVEENREMRRILREAAADLPDEALRSRVQAAAAVEDDDLRVRVLNERNAELRSVLVELHAFVEERREPWARRIDRAIWDELRASTKRRAISFYPS